MAESHSEKQRVWDRVRALFDIRVGLALTLTFVVGTALVFWHMFGVTRDLVRLSALEGTARYAEALTEFRAFYTSEVVARSGIAAAHDYRAREGVLPLPATLTLELGRRIGQQGSGMQVRLYSEYPFPWRTDGGPRDLFEREALEELRRKPEKPFYRFESVNGREVLRYAVADRLRVDCVSCHNTRSDSPRHDWKEGDVRGVLEITRPLDSIIAQTRAGLSQTFIVMGGIGALGLAGLTVVISRFRGINRELEQKVARRTAALEDSRGFLDSIIDELPVMLFVKDAEQLRFVRFNRTGEELLGVRRSDLIGKSDYDLFPGDQADFFTSRDRAVLNEHRLLDIAEEPIQTPFGLRYLHTRKVVIPGADGEPRYLLGVSEDITERKHIAEQLALAHEREAQIGFRIQQTLLLNQPPRDISGVSIAAITIPSQAIDGDFYDFFKHSNTYLDVMIGDVMGKGVPAALLGAATKTNILQALSRLLSAANHKRPEPRDILTVAHAGLTPHLVELDSFVTLCYARFDLERRQVDIVDCGHTPTLHYRAAAGQCARLQGVNMPLGVSEREVFEQVSSRFDPGDVLVFYSDGLTEAKNSAGELFGLDRLAAFVENNATMSPEDLISAIRSAVVEFCGSERFQDDLTCVVLTIGEGQATGRQASMEISSNLQDLPRTRAFVREFCFTQADPPLEEERVEELELAVTEAASNIMRHAYRGRADEWIRMEAEALPDRITIRLHYFGEPFDPATVAEPAFDGTREGGFGVHLIAQSVDEVRYFRDDRGRNGVCLTKKRFIS